MFFRASDLFPILCCVFEKTGPCPTFRKPPLYFDRTGRLLSLITINHSVAIVFLIISYQKLRVLQDFFANITLSMFIHFVNVKILFTTNLILYILIAKFIFTNHFLKLQFLYVFVLQLLLFHYQCLYISLLKYHLATLNCLYKAK